MTMWPLFTGFHLGKPVSSLLDSWDMCENNSVFIGFFTVGNDSICRRVWCEHGTPAFDQRKVDWLSTLIRKSQESGSGVANC